MSHRAAHGLAVVTGASSGIGAEIARHLARRGQPVLAVARRRDRLEALRAASAHAPIHPFAADLSERAAATRILEEARRLGGATWLVNNAGFGMYGPFAEAPADRLADMVRLNCESLVVLTRTFLDDLLHADRGVVLDVASMAGFQPTPFMAAYGATKAFVLSFSEALREELARTRVTVTAFCPGPVATEFQEVAGFSARLRTSPGTLTAEAAAKAAISAADRGRDVAVPGRLQQAAAVAVQLFPRALVRRASRQLLRPRTEENAPAPPWSR
jgi:short-subunit dehydrogenase